MGDEDLREIERNEEVVALHLRVKDLEQLVKVQGETITALAETAKALMETVEVVAGMMTDRGDRT